MRGSLADVARLMEQAGVRYVVIGAHAVNAWLEPRATADVDLTIEAGVADHARLRDTLLAAGFREAAADRPGAPSGPDFVRYVSEESTLRIEVQTAKTALQQSVLDRARRTDEGVLVATPEDLIVLKLIAGRAKDEIDLVGLVRLTGLDWPYVERWADEWQVADRLFDVRRRAASGGA
jgi:predicted nucleotidyltransferase